VTVAAGRTKAQELTTALSVLSNVRVNPLGLVLTHATRSAMEHGSGGAARARRTMLHRLEWDWKRDRSKQSRRHRRPHEVTPEGQRRRNSLAVEMREREHTRRSGWRDGGPVTEDDSTQPPGETDSV
jgi:hypothetical protein